MTYLRRAFTYIYLPLIVVYLGMTFVFPTDNATTAKYQLGLVQARVLSFSIATPLIIIWLIAFYGASRLKKYSLRIKKDEDGRIFRDLATGLQLLALSLPIRAVVKIILNYLAQRHPSLATLTTELISYVNLVVPLVSFILISWSARRLVQSIKARQSLRAYYTLGLVFVSLAVLYCYTMLNVHRSIPATNWLITTQQLIPTPVRLLTITMPYLFMWYLALHAIYDMYLYQTYVRGIFYRRAFRLLYLGFTALIAVSILLQFITSLSPTLNKLSLSWILILAYWLMALLAVSFIMIAKGVGHLKKLEKI